MHFSTVGDGFLTVCECSSFDRQNMLRFIQFLYDTNAREKIRQSPFSPSGLTWDEWASKSFIGFSSDKVILKTGFSFDTSIRTNSPTLEHETNTSTFHKRLRYLRMALVPPQINVGHTLNSEGYKKLHLRFYPNAEYPESETNLFKIAPMQYILAHEMIELMQGTKTPDNLLEIGSGAGVTAAMHMLRCGTKTVTLIDLPETFFVSYIFLRHVLPEVKILLPQDFDPTRKQEDSSIQMILPHQALDISEPVFDRSINMSSFQEMDIGTVNAYLNLSAKLLAPGGSFNSNNQIVARHIPGNSLERYDLSAELSPNLVFEHLKESGVSG